MAGDHLPGRRFTDAEDSRLLRLRARGYSLAQIAAVLGRSKSSVQIRLDLLEKRNVTMANASGAAGRLLSYIQRIERLQEEIKALQSDVKDVKAEAKSAGFDTKVIGQMLRERKMDASDRAEWQALCDLYRANLGMLDGTPLGEAARKRFTGEDDDEAKPNAVVPPEAAAQTADDVPAARAQGAEAAKGGIKVTANPYPFDDPRRAAWDEGWCAAAGSDGMELPDAWRRKKPSKGDGKSGGQGQSA